VATRFYLPSSGTSPLDSLADSAIWNEVAACFYRAPLVTTKSNTSLTDFSENFTAGTTANLIIAQFTSVALSSGISFTTSHTLSGVIRGLEANWACDAYITTAVRVVSGDGATVRGTIFQAISTPELNYTTAKTRIWNAVNLTAVTAQTGDRIVVELGFWGQTPDTGYDVTIRLGDPSGTADFALTEDLVTDLCPWIELSPDLTFSAAAPDTDLFLDGIWG